MKNVTILIVFLMTLSIQTAHSYPKDNLPDTTIWEYKGVVFKDVDSIVFQPLHIINSSWDSLNQTYILNKIPHKVFNLNTYDEENSKSHMDYGKRGGDYLITKIIDIRNLKNPYLTFLYQRAGIYPNRGNTGWCDSILCGPEGRVAKYLEPLIGVQEPDLLLIEFISSDSANLNTLKNPKETDWNIHPRRGSADPEINNPAMSIFGSGGYRRGFLERDKDSALSLINGLRANNYDSGNDDRFERFYIPIPDTMLKRGFIRVRFRIDALRNGNGINVVDDKDDFFLDDININQGDPDIALNSIYIQNPYSILNINTKFEIPVWINVSGIKINPNDSLSLKLKICHIDEPSWFPSPDETGYTGNEPYSELSLFKFSALPKIDSNCRIINMPKIKIKRYEKYLKHGINIFKVWAIINSNSADMIKSNDTLYLEFKVFMGKSIAYDDPVNPTNDVPKFTSKPGRGIGTYGFSSGEDILDIYNTTKITGSGSIGASFDLVKNDTVYGYQVYWGSANQEQKDIEMILNNSNTHSSWDPQQDSRIRVKRGYDDIRKDFFSDEYITYLLPKPTIIPYEGKWHVYLFQLGGKSFELGGCGYRMGNITTVYQPLEDTTKKNDWGQGGYSIMIDKCFRIFNSSTNLINKNSFFYENTKGSGNWRQFTPTIGNPAYAHLNHLGTVADSINTYTRGTFLPMIRLYMDGSHYTWSGVGNENKTSNEIDISPNPATDFIEISVGANGPSPLQSDVRIYDVYGQIQTTPSLRDTPPWKGGEKVRIDVSGLAQGMYFVRVGDRVQKFIKI